MNVRTLVTAASLCLIAPVLHAGPENVSAPGDYRQTMTHYFSGDRTANDKQAIRVYANDIAIEGKKRDGNLPYGSVIVAEIYKVKTGDDGMAQTSTLGRRIRDKFAAVVVMERGKGFDEGYADNLKTGDWEFAVFSPDGKRLDKDITGCRACHNPLSSQQFVFSYQHLGQ